MRPELAAQQITCGRAYRNRQIKHSEDAAALVFRKKIGHEGWGDGDEGRFSDANQGVADKQLPVSVRNRSEQRKAAPEDRSQNNDHFAGIAVSQRPRKRGSDHVKAEKGACKISNLRVAEMEFTLHQRLYRKQNRAVDIVEQVQRREQDERGPGIKFRRGHLAKEYITVG